MPDTHRKSWKKAIIPSVIWVIVYIVAYFGCALVLLNWEDRYNSFEQSPLNTMQGFEIAAYIVYRFLLNFPFSVFSWFTDSTLYLTLFFLVPNAIGSRFLFRKIVARTKRA
jgi:hypothetical protein